MNSTFKIHHLKVRLHVLSPIHIGCDDVYEPTSFIIDENKKKLIEFDPMDFIKELSLKERDEFIRTCSGDNLLAIFKFIKREYKPSIMGREVEIAEGLIAHYKKVLQLPTYDKKVIINQFTIDKTAHNTQSNIPYIPGSSVKGSLRTAYLSWLASTKNISKGWTKYLASNDLRDDQSTYFAIGNMKVAKRMEVDLLQGDFDTDPFRMVKVADMLPVGDFKTKIFYAKNRKKKMSDKPTRAEKLTQIMEVIQSGTVFEGIININQPIQKGAILNPVDGSFLKLVNDFYVSELNKEKVVVKEICADHIDISKFNGKLGESAFLVRIGRHSGAEAVTIERNRHIKIMQDERTPPKYLDHATTLWLASETSKPSNNNSLMPFGWAMLEILPEGCEPPPLPILSRNASFRKSTDNISKKEVPVEAARVKLPPETFIWDTVILTWNPGNQTLKAEKDGKRAEVKVTDRNIVPGGLHKKLFEKRVAATGNVEVAAVGNSFKIVKVF